VVNRYLPFVANTSVGATLTMDDDYQRERAARAANQAKHAGEGIAYGFRDFGIGIYKGITGIVTEPIKGGKKDGALGVLKGVGKGLAGFGFISAGVAHLSPIVLKFFSMNFLRVVLKPAVGAVDLFTRTTEGIKNTTTYFDEKSKAPIRPSRYFPPDKLVTTYHLENSAGQQILKTVEPAEYRKEHYVSHMAVKEACVLATTARLLFLEQQVLQFGNVWNVEWAEVLQSS
jgi:vacuolar protein sorting-associated protein 13A/C